MKKLILSSVAVLGLSAGFSAPAQAQVLVGSPSQGASMTGAASFTNFNGSTSAIAGQVTFPSGIFVNGTNVDIAPVADPAVPATDGFIGTAAGGDLQLVELGVTPEGTVDNTTLIPGATANVEAAVATAITGDATTTLNARVSLIRAWRSGLD
jgi:hypothetical protein